MLPSDCDDGDVIGNCVLSNLHSHRHRGSRIMPFLLCVLHPYQTDTVSSLSQALLGVPIRYTLHLVTALVAQVNSQIREWIRTAHQETIVRNSCGVWFACMYCLQRIVVHAWLRGVPRLHSQLSQFSHSQFPYRSMPEEYWCTS